MVAIKPRARTRVEAKINAKRAVAKPSKKMIAVAVADGVAHIRAGSRLGKIASDALDFMKKYDSDFKKLAK